MKRCQGCKRAQPSDHSTNHSAKLVGRHDPTAKDATDARDCKTCPARPRYADQGPAWDQLQPAKQNWHYENCHIKLATPAFRPVQVGGKSHPACQVAPRVPLNRKPRFFRNSKHRAGILTNEGSDKYLVSVCWSD